MPVRARLFTDPACTASWGAEPSVRRLLQEFGTEVDLTFVMGGLARHYSGDLSWLVTHWLDVSEETGMPLDPRLWSEGPIGSSYPACMAVKAAAMQADDRGAAYLRSVREGLVCFRRKLDTTEALVEEARRTGLDVERFRVDLASNATVESFGADLELARDVPPGAETGGRGDRVTLPSLCCEGESGEAYWVFGNRPYQEWRQAAMAAGATPTGTPDPAPLAALSRFPRMATREVEVVCGLAGPRAPAELWALALDGRVRPLEVMTGHLWEAA